MNLRGIFLRIMSVNGSVCLPLLRPSAEITVLILCEGLKPWLMVDLGGRQGAGAVIEFL